jgi:Kef-type K+ transport system membrane component KefB
MVSLSLVTTLSTSAWYELTVTLTLAWRNGTPWQKLVSITKNSWYTFFMSLFLQLAILLAIILLAAKLAGYIAIRLGQPSVLGELLMGILLGPSLLNLLHLPAFNEETMKEILRLLGEIGVVFLLFVAGLELHLDELSRNMRTSALAGILGVLFPFFFGMGTGLIFSFTLEESIFLGIILGASSVSISAQTLMELKQLKSRVGLSLLGAAVFDDILVILMLSLFFAFSSDSTSVIGLLLVFGRMLVFFALSFLFGLWALPYIIRKVRNLPVSQNILTLAIVVLLFYAISAELIGGMAAITGAFLAGLMFARSPEKEVLEPRIHALAYGFFVPIFFVNIGLTVNIFALKDNLLLGVVVIIAAILGKFFGAGLGGRWAGLSGRESMQLGIGMMPRAEVSLIAGSIGFSAGLVNAAESSAIIGMVIICTLITPPILRYLFHEK